MADDRSAFGREDALVCADVLGGFGVASDHVRDIVGVEADLEVALQNALAAGDHPTAFVKRAVASAPRGVDAPAEFWTTAPETQLGDVFASLSWTFDVRSANGRSLAVDDEQPYRLRVEDADGRTRTTDFSFPDTPLGDDNYPALVHAVNDDLLFGLDCRIVQLSDGSERWRFALVETEEFDRLREQFGDGVAVFGRPVLEPDQPDAYVPDDSAGAAAGWESTVPVPEWAVETDDQDDTERSFGERELTAASFDADYVGGLEHLTDAGSPSPGASSSTSGASSSTEGDDWTDGPGAGEDRETGAGTGSTSTAAPIEFVDSGAAADEQSTAEATRSSGSSDLTGRLEPVDTVEIRDADVEADEAKGRGADDDLDGWSIGGTVDATTRSSASSADASVDAGADASAEVGADAPTGGVTDGDDARSGSGFEWGPTDTSASSTTSTSSSRGGDGPNRTRSDRATGNAASSIGDAPTDEVGSGPDPASEASGKTSDVSGKTSDVSGKTSDVSGDEDDGFFSADAVSSFQAGAKQQRVEEDSFGVDGVEQSEDDQFAAVGAAMSAPARISVGGLLDDDEFLPEIPRAEPAHVRIEFEDEFDPSASGDREERETEDGFVWVNESGGVGEKRSSVFD